MVSLTDVIPRTKTLTFDCYGTLIDWRAGITRALGEIFGSQIEGRLDEIYASHASIEAELEQPPYRSYRTVLTELTRRIADRFDLELLPNQAGLLAASVPNWPAFPDTCDALLRLKKCFRLGILSNVDRDLFAGTRAQLGVEFDFVVTAEDVRSYKPAHGHFDRLIAEHAQKDEVLHVAQSLFHDGVPAGELGIAYAWINRYNDTNQTSAKPLAEFPDLVSLTDAVGA